METIGAFPWKPLELFTIKLRVFKLKTHLYSSQVPKINPKSAHLKFQRNKRAFFSDLETKDNLNYTKGLSFEKLLDNWLTKQVRFM